jgi:hypothetical protein
VVESGRLEPRQPLAATAPPGRISNWALTSLQQRLVRTGGRLAKHARYYWLLLAESHLTRRLFVGMLRKSQRCQYRGDNGLLDRGIII